MNLFVLSPDFSCAISKIITVAIAHKAWAHFFQMARLLGKFIPKSTTLEQRAISRLLRMRAFKTNLNALHISAFLRFTSQATQVSIPLTEPITFCRPGYNCFCLVWTVRFYTHTKKVPVEKSRPATNTSPQKYQALIADDEKNRSIT